MPLLPNKKYYSTSLARPAFPASWFQCAFSLIFIFFCAVVVVVVVVLQKHFIAMPYVPVSVSMQMGRYGEWRNN